MQNFWPRERATQGLLGAGWLVGVLVVVLMFVGLPHLRAESVPNPSSGEVKQVSNAAEKPVRVETEVSSQANAGTVVNPLNSLWTFTLIVACLAFAMLCILESATFFQRA